MTKRAPHNTNELESIVDSQWLRRFRRNLTAWYAKHARDLPWRRTRDAYRIWISEIMLQQTTVAAVTPYFERFLARFPDVRALAAADLQDVLRLWEGLGYYTRGRNIHKTAQLIVAEHGGTFPADSAELTKLPGVGRYTAGAIASFAYDRRAPIVEANTLRLYSRLLGYRGDPKSTAGQRLLWSFAERILPSKNCGAFNQALMELGATVCTPARPRCEECPVRSCCRAFAGGAQNEIPAMTQRAAVTDVTEASVAVRRRDGAYLLRLRGAGERWAGLWDFPRFEVSNGAFENTESAKRRTVVPAKLRRFLESEVRARTGVESRTIDTLGTMRHGVTRFRIRLLCFLAESVDAAEEDRDGLRWVKPNDFGDLPLSVTGRKLATLLQRREADAAPVSRR